MQLHCCNIQAGARGEGGGVGNVGLAGSRGQLVLLILEFFCNELRKAFYSNSRE